MKSINGLISPFRNEYSADEGCDFLYTLARCIQDFGGDLWEGDHLKDTGVDGRDRKSVV